MIEAIIFDLDDTLFDQFSFLESAFGEIGNKIAQKGYGNAKENSEKLIGYAKKYGSASGSIFNRLLDFYDIDEDQQKPIIKELVPIFRNHEPNQLELLPGVQKLLFRLKETYILGLITNGAVKIQKKKVELLDISKFFKVIIYPDSYGREFRKPHHLPYKEALKNLEIPAENTVYVGDNPHIDFKGAKELGMKTIRVLFGEYKNLGVEEEKKAHIRINSILDVETGIEALNKRN